LSKGTITDPAPRQFGSSTSPEPGPEPIPIPNPEGLVWDSNRDIKWETISGEELKVTSSYGNIKANGKGFHMNASGDPRMYLKKATKEMWLEHDGSYGRCYICVTNYNSRLECEFMLDSCNSNFSFKTRNRHQVNEEGGYNVTDEHSQGGIGGSAHCNSIGNQVEVVHGTNTLDKDFPLDPKLEPNKWYKLKYTVKDVDANTLTQITELDRNDGQGFKAVSRQIDPPKQFFYKTDFDTWSEFWLRLNNPNGGVLKFRNVRLYAL
jgi:hypothetical protein